MLYEKLVVMDSSITKRDNKGSRENVGFVMFKVD